MVVMNHVKVEVEEEEEEVELLVCSLWISSKEKLVAACT